MKEYTIEVIIDADGNLRAETGGIVGPTCVEELDRILAGLEGERKATNTGDYYKKSQQTVRAKVRVGRN